MTVEPTKAMKLFYCYDHEDRALRSELDKHLRNLRWQGQISSWHDYDINAGEEWQREIYDHLNTAHIILLLISPDFMNSDYCYSIEMKRALERHNTKEARVIPIILRPIDFENAPFSKLQVLPRNGKPITKWRNRDDAFQEVAKEIRNIVKKLLTKQCLNEGAVLYSFGHYEEALAAYEQAIRLDPNDALAYNDKGNTLSALARYEEALTAYKQAIRLDPNYALAYSGKGSVLYNLERYEEALATYEQAIRLDPSNALTYNYKGDTLYKLKRYEEALAVYEHATHLDRNYAFTYKGDVLYELKRYEEALAAYNSKG